MTKRRLTLLIISRKNRLEKFKFYSKAEPVYICRVVTKQKEQIAQSILVNHSFSPNFHFDRQRV